MMFPMRRARALEIIARHERELRDVGVRSLSLFGSVARDRAAPGSDVDLLVESDRPVDLVTAGGLRPELRQEILAEAVRAA
jgi:predicted nucleotidyltransferase